MGKNRELTELQRKEIEILYKQHKTEREIAQVTRIPKSTVHDTIMRIKRYGTLKSGLMYMNTSVHKFMNIM